MAFEVTADPTAFTLTSGSTQDVAFTFSGVTPDVVGSAVLTFQLGAETVNVTLNVTVDEPGPTVGEIVTPEGVTAEVLTLDNAGATVRFTR